jgi:5'-nucleotidase / UDP-sugar diphosphatase
MSKKFFFGAVAAVLAATLALPARAGNPVTLTILHTNDTHSALVPFGPCGEYGGIARMSAMIKRIRAMGGNVLALNAGDVSVGSFEFNKYLGYPELKIMDGLYDAMALGNHEFDLGLDVLTGVLAGAPELGCDLGPVEIPALCANITFPPGSFLASRIQPRLIKEFGGLKVGIFGLADYSQLDYSQAVYEMLSDPIASAASQAAELKAEGCAVVICLSHLGKAWDVEGLSAVPGIDVIVGGHSHDAMIRPIIAGGKIIVQAGEFGKYLGELKLSVAGGVVGLVGYRLHDLTWTRQDPSLKPRLDALKRGIVTDPRFGDVYGRRVALAVRDIERTWPIHGPHPEYRDTGIGNMVADAMKSGVLKAGYPADISIEVMGYTAANLIAGKIVGNDILRAVPYGYDPESGLGFKVVVVPVTGELLLGLMEFSVSMIEATQDLCLQPSGLKFAYDSRLPAAPFGSLSRVDPYSVRVNGSPIDFAGVYFLVMNEQVFKTIAAMLPPDTLTAIETGLFEYTLVRDYLKSLGNIRYAPQGRVIDVALR